VPFEVLWVKAVAALAADSRQNASMRILFLHGWTSKPGGVKPSYPAGTATKSSTRPSPRRTSRRPGPERVSGGGKK
jgi:hypothetical protein